MPTYSVAEAKNRLPDLIDRAIEGEEVVITRHGKPVVELRTTTHAPLRPTPATYTWLQARRRARKAVGITSEELLRQIYDDS
jgi:antitoxin (DNA-binding transcriptional repressor) of toxin-antitoxin stability system